MFLDNKYKRLYYKIIDYRKCNPCNSAYKEKHHIIPRSLGGLDDLSNIVELSLREHFIVHRLLTKFTSDDSYVKMMWAVHRMLFKDVVVGYSRIYEKLRMNHVKFLRLNHPSKKFLDFSDRMRKQALLSWEGDYERRLQHSVSMKNKQAKWKNDPEYIQNQTRRAKLGGLAAREKNSKRLEYNGIIYVGWDDLFDKTKVTRHLYNKYYLKGIDPSPRIGKDGPITKLMTVNSSKEVNH